METNNKREAQALILRDSESVAQEAIRWTQLETGERKRRGKVAASELALEPLLSLMDSWGALYGTRGAKLSIHTRTAYRLSARLLCDFCQAQGWNLSRPPKDLGAAWKLHLEGSGLSVSTVRQRLAGARMLAAALRWAGVLDSDPFPATLRPVADRTTRAEKAKSYTPEEVQALLGAARDCRERCSVALLAHGLRLCELLSLRWDDLDRTRQALRVRGKGAKVRTVYLDTPAWGFLISLEREGERVIYPPITPQGFRKRIRSLCILAGVPYKGAHALRHFCGEQLYRATGDLGAVADHLGHASLDTSRIYAKRSAALPAIVKAGVLPALLQN
jgi:integrase/recombinase XerC